MRSISAVLCASVALLATAAERPSDDKLFMREQKPAKVKKQRVLPTTLKGYALGMSLDAFKQRPSPQNLNGPTRLVCSDDPEMQPSLAPKFRGEVVCGFQLLRHGDWEPGGLMLDATHGAIVTFRFFGNSLVQIESQEDAGLADVIRQSLTTQYGQPSQITNRTSQSISNQVSTQVIVTWINGGDSIVMVAPNLGTDQMSVVYTNLAGFAAMQGSGKNG